MSTEQSGGGAVRTVRLVSWTFQRENIAWWKVSRLEDSGGSGIGPWMRVRVGCKLGAAAWNHPARGRVPPCPLEVNKYKDVKNNTLTRNFRMFFWDVLLKSWSSSLAWFRLFLYIHTCSKASGPIWNSSAILFSAKNVENEWAPQPHCGATVVFLSICPSTIFSGYCGMRSMAEGAKCDGYNLTNLRHPNPTGWVENIMPASFSSQKSGWLGEDLSTLSPQPHT